MDIATPTRPRPSSTSEVPADDTITTISRTRAGRPEALDFHRIDLDAIGFAGYPDPRAVLQPLQHLGAFRADPPVHAFRDAIYTPAGHLGPGRYFGCLYDRARRRIEPSCIRRGLDENATLDPVIYPGSDDLETVYEPVMYLGTLFGHYGHFLLESLPRWWATLPVAERPRKFLVHPYAGQEPRHLSSPFIQRILAALEIDPGDLLYFDRPVRVRRVTVPEPSLRIRYYHHACFRSLLSSIVDRIVPERIEQTEQPLFLSRSRLRGVRAVEGEAVLDELLARHGFAVVHPQEESLETQIRLVNRHRTIVGLTGSAMHNVLFARRPPRTVHLTGDRIHGNYVLTDDCAGATSTFVHAFHEVSRPLRRVRNTVVAALRGRSPFDALRAPEARYVLDLEYVRAWLRQSGFFPR